MTTSAGSTVNYNGGAAQAAKVTTYSNLTISGSLAKSFTATPTVNGILSMEGAATISVGGTGVVTYGANATLPIQQACELYSYRCRMGHTICRNRRIRIMGAGPTNDFRPLDPKRGSSA